MRLVVVADAAAIAASAAEWVARETATGRLAALAVGRSVAAAYAELARAGAAQSVRAVTIDELYPLPAGDPRAFGAQLEAALGVELVSRFDTTTADPDAEAERMSQLVLAEGLGALVLGVGPNGHLAMNEPGSALDAPSRYVPLTRSTLAHLGGRAAVRPVTGAMTLSLPTLLSADRVLCVVAGANKQRALHRMLLGPMTTAMPASVLRLHPDVTILFSDTEAALLPRWVGALAHDSGLVRANPAAQVSPSTR